MRQQKSLYLCPLTLEHHFTQCGCCMCDNILSTCYQTGVVLQALYYQKRESQADSCVSVTSLPLSAVCSWYMMPSLKFDTSLRLETEKHGESF